MTPRQAIAAGRMVETINLRIIRPALAVVHIRLHDVHLRNLIAERRQDGSVRIRPPKIITRNGNDLGPAFALQPHARTVIEAAVCELWSQVEAVNGERPR